MGPGPLAIEDGSPMMAIEDGSVEDGYDMSFDEEAVGDVAETQVVQEPPPDVPHPNVSPNDGKMPCETGNAVPEPSEPVSSVKDLSEPASAMPSTCKQQQFGEAQAEHSVRHMQQLREAIAARKEMLRWANTDRFVYRYSRYSVPL